MQHDSVTNKDNESFCWHPIALRWSITMILETSTTYTEVSSVNTQKPAQGIHLLHGRKGVLLKLDRTNTHEVKRLVRHTQKLVGPWWQNRLLVNMNVWGHFFPHLLVRDVICISVWWFEVVCLLADVLSGARPGTARLCRLEAAGGLIFCVQSLSIGRRRAERHTSQTWHLVAPVNLKAAGCLLHPINFYSELSLKKVSTNINCDKTKNKKNGENWEGWLTVLTLHRHHL